MKLTESMNRSLVFSFILLFLYSCNYTTSNDHTTWAFYAGTKDGNRYSSNQQINLGNVGSLQVAWTFSTHDKDTANRSEIQCNPIVVDGILFGVSPKLKLFALDASSGDQKWIFDPAEINPEETPRFGITRGVVYWEDEKGDNQRILYSGSSYLYAVDARDGTLITTFGDNGSVDLREGLDQDNTSKKSALGKTPGVIFKDLLIMGMSVSEGEDALPGHIRAYNVRTGEREWIFHTIPQPGEIGYESWEDPEAYKKIGGANNWAGMSLDEETGIVYVPTGSASPDFYGGTRKGANLFANSIIALEAATGKYVWHYQVVHHDLWDRDLPANPNLVNLDKDGKKIKALAQITKQGFVFLLDRTNGHPVFPIEERPVPQEALPGEKPWPTQPYPTLPEPFSRQHFGPEDVNDLDSLTYPYLMERYLKIRDRKHFSPPSKEGGWMFPDFGGGGEWGGASVDPETQILYVNSNEVPSTLIMIDAPQKQTGEGSLEERAMATYSNFCMSCHGQNLKGNGDEFPSLFRLNEKYSPPQIKKIINQGINRMPSFEQVPEKEKNELVEFLMDISEEKIAGLLALEKENLNSKSPKDQPVEKEEIPYLMAGYTRFVDKNGYPGNTPPWGTLNAVDLNSGKLLWKVPLGEYAELTKKGIPITGTRNYGGPVVTKGGLLFIAATLDEKIRAFDKHSGNMVWEASLPAAGYATPAVYQIDGKQFVVIACGGGKLGTKSGDTYVAFSLP
jgi:quinoprotein glucose dehydrogenase